MSKAADYGRGYSGNRSEEMTQQQQDILNEAIDVCQNEMQANNPKIPRMTFACGFALASMLSVLKMEGEDDDDMVTIDEMIECAVMRIVKARNENEAVKKAIMKIDKRDRSRYRLYEVTEVMI